VSLLRRLLSANHFAAQLLNAIQPLLALATRIYVGWQFFSSGWLKITSWDTTLWLFNNEYHTPVLSPTVAAVMGTAGELSFPILLWLGLFGRLGALGLQAVNIIAVVSYAHVLLAEGGEAPLGQHVLWGFMLLTLAVYGPGRLSLDYLLTRERRASPEKVTAPVTI
jgi:putative oxidoreductase